MVQQSFKIKLPATSANLGPGFDAVALALSLYLEVEATPAEAYSVSARGRNADICGSVSNNLLLETYQRVLKEQGIQDMPLSLKVQNGIPIGMGLGSSAAARLAGVALAAHFGNLDWDRSQILTEASRMEGHPDNTAACWLGGYTVACWHKDEVVAISLTPRSYWRALVVVPQNPLSTHLSRKAVPESFSRADAVANIQRVALLTAAFASGHSDVMPTATQDRLHQPYRAEVCPLLKKLLPLAEQEEVLSVTLSGAGPSVLVLVESDFQMNRVQEAIRARVVDEPIEILTCHMELDPAHFLQNAAK
ncbi:MAG: homoserine kinase [Acidobacterium ailaaui]|nr:homoserine kinase [Pseudacidobacterium ailaaui]MCL6464889.1 homoserine kinase [Pseudacidobacterium ailaaui]